MWQTLAFSLVSAVYCEKESTFVSKIDNRSCIVMCYVFASRHFVFVVCESFIKSNSDTIYWDGHSSKDSDEREPKTGHALTDSAETIS